MTLHVLTKGGQQRRNAAKTETLSLEELDLYIGRCRQMIKDAGEDEHEAFFPRFWLKDLIARRKRLSSSPASAPNLEEQP